MDFNWNYLSKTRGINGRIKEQIEDFIVKERSVFHLGKDDHLIFYLTKYNLTTLDAIRELSNILHISQERFGFAGNKDKRAITTQAISVKGLNEDDLRQVFLPNMEISVIGKGKHIGVGQLEGNEFEITIRNINLPEEEIRKRLENIYSELNGMMPNYFGEQRFGVIRPITHLVGKEILKGNYEEAVWLYISKTSEKETERIKKIRKEVKNTEEISRAAEKFPTTHRFEKILLYHLAKKRDDYLGALKQLPEGLQKLFIHSYQSYIFNEALSNLVEEKDFGEYELPLIGYKTNVKKEGPESEILEVLDQEKIPLENFKLKDIPHLRSEGTYRKAFVPYKNFKILSIKEDELNIDKNMVKLRFYLNEGCYATSLLREFMKNSG